MSGILKFHTTAKSKAKRRTGVRAEAAPAAAELLIYGAIGDSWFGESVDAKGVVDAIRAANASSILVRINSEGGSVTDGIAIYNALRDSAAHVTVRVEGVAASIASLIAMAGDEIQMHANTLMMVHAPWAYAAGNAAELRKYATMLDAHGRAMAETYAQQTGATVDAVMAEYLDGEDHWLTAADAVDAGLADVVLDAPAANDADADVAACNGYVAAALDRYHVAPALRASLAPALTRTVTVQSPEAMREAVLAGLRAPDRSTPAAPRATVHPAAAAASLQVQPMNWTAIAAALGVSVAADADVNAVRAAVVAHLHLAADADDAAVAAALVRPAAATPAAPVARIGAMGRNEQIEQMFAIALRGPRAESRPLADLRDRVLIDQTVTVEQARAQLLAALNNGAEPLAGTHAVDVTADAVDKRRTAMVDATLARIGKAKANGANPYRGYRLLDLARATLEESGVQVRGMHPMEIARMALGSRVMAAGMNTTGDFPVVLENTMHKLVLDGFAAVAPTWQAFCKQGDVSDFRAWNRLVPGLIGNLDGVTEGQDYPFKNLPDASKNAIQAKRHGNIIRISQETLVNDDTGYIANTAAGLGMAGARAIERSVYALLAANPTLADGSALFSGAHANQAASGSGGAPSVTTLDAARQAMAQQKFPGEDAEFMDIHPAVAVAHTSVEGTLRVVIGSPYDPDASSKLQRPNMVQNLVGTIVGSPRVPQSGSWYLFADPALAPVIEVVFLDGQRQPNLVQEQHFESGALQWRVELPFGVGAIDFRGGYFNYGA